MAMRKKSNLVFVVLIMIFTYSSLIISQDNYELVKLYYNGEKVKIFYPQIQNLGDEKRQKIINDLIKKDVPGDKSRYEYYEKPNSDSFYELDYQVKWKGPNLLSIRYLGIRYEKNTPHPTHLSYTTNIDLKHGKRLSLKDIVDINKDFVGKIKKGKYTQWDSGLKLPEDILQSVLDNYSDEKMIKYLNQSDIYDTYCYFTQDSLGVSFEVSHAIGDHVEFEVKYRDIINYIDKTNNIWNDFPGIFKGK